MNFLKELEKRVLVLDGSMGAYLQRKGLPPGKAPDLLNLDSPELIYEVHKAYVDAGADIVLTNTFGSSRPRLSEHGYGNRMGEIIASAVKMAKRAVGSNGFVAGDIGPSGLIPQPTGDHDFDEVVGVFREQAQYLVDEGCDLIVLETFFDLQELRAAIIGVREASSTIPISAFMTFTPDGKTDTGVTPEAAAVVLEKLGATTVGANCSTGPEDMVKVLERFSAATYLPLACEPNAGLPETINGSLCYSLGPKEVADYTTKFLDSGVRIIGGCCGTVPETIALIRKIVDGYTPKKRETELEDSLFLASISKTVEIGKNSSFKVIGERINPTGRKKFAKSLMDGDINVALTDGKKQEKKGADILDVNVGVPGCNEVDLMKKVITRLVNNISLPLTIDSSNIEALEMGLKLNPGRSLINSVNCEKEKMEKLFPIAKKYGAAIICLLTGESVPESVEERLEFAEILLENAKKHGLSESDLIFDGLSLAVSAMQNGAKGTVEVIRVLSSKGLRTTLGLSNVSFGMPNRTYINMAFLSLCMKSGLDCAIMNPLKSEMMASVLATTLFLNREPSIQEITEKLSEIKIETKKTTGAKSEIKESKKDKSAAELLGDSVIDGDRDNALKLSKQLINEGVPALDIFLKILSPAMKKLGDLFAERKKFIPHLVAGAEAMKVAVDFLKPYLKEDKKSDDEKRVIFATVKGDVHDIGKNICVLMLENGGYNVTDLGKSVDTNIIVKTAKEMNASLVCLSALMTTTMVEMEPCIKKLKEILPDVKVIVGGAVVTEEYAKKIGADGYSEDASSIIMVADSLLGRK